VITFQWTVPAGLPAAGVVRNCFIMIPSSPKASKRAVLYQWASYAGGGVWSIPELSDPNAKMLCQLGLFVIGIDQVVPGGSSNGSYGAYRTEIAAWWSYVQTTYGIGPLLSGWLRSRGGMWGNLAADTPNFFDRLVGLAHITDAQSYDSVGIAMDYTGDTANPPAVTNFDTVPSVGCPTLPTPAGNALSLLQQNALNDRVAAIAASAVPMYFAYGTADTTVAPASNVLTFASNYAAIGGSKLKILAVAGADHATITETLYQPLIDFMVCDNPEQVMTLPLYSKGCLTAAQSVTGGSETQIHITALDDPSGMINGSNQMVIPIGGGGLWDFRGRVQIGSLPASTKFWLAVRKNGGNMTLQQTTSCAVTTDTDAIPVMDSFVCADGDVIDYAIYVFDAVSHGLTVNSNTTLFTAERRS
jgi:hypothetical protein